EMVSGTRARVDDQSWPGGTGGVDDRRGEAVEEAGGENAESRLDHVGGIGSGRRVSHEEGDITLPGHVQAAPAGADKSPLTSQVAGAERAAQKFEHVGEHRTSSGWARRPGQAASPATAATNVCSWSHRVIRS